MNLFFQNLYPILFSSEAEPKGSDCFEKFVDMQECMKEYPQLYEDDEDPMAAATEESEKDSSSSESDNKAMTKSS